MENGELVNQQESYTDSSFKSYLRNLALKVLSLKVAAHIKWNLSELSFKILFFWASFVQTTVLHFRSDQVVTI